MKKVKFRVWWIDHGREPQCKPDPNYPNGIDLDVSGGKNPSCSSDLPYPARRCGYFKIKCVNCGQVIAVTTAGRPDDPRSIKMACLSDTIERVMKQFESGLARRDKSSTLH